MTSNEIDQFVSTIPTAREKLRIAEALVYAAKSEISDAIHARRSACGKFLGDMYRSAGAALDHVHHAWSCIAAYEAKQDQAVADGMDPEEIE